jgi:hypothetical protein
MSLKVEERLADTYNMLDEPMLYTTGAWLVPMEFNTSKGKRYVWAAAEFSPHNDGNFIAGEPCSPAIYSDSAEGLWEQDKNDDDKIE